jgi:hypothetical protein
MLARIRSFNEHLNRADHRFDFKRDQIMKACLVLTDASSVRFQIESHANRRVPFQGFDCGQINGTGLSTDPRSRFARSLRDSLGAWLPKS